MTEKLKERVISVAIQGGFGSFHEIAARQFFNGTPIRISPCETFEDLFDALAERKVDSGIVAIENSVAGSILPNYARLLNSGLWVAGEAYLRIVQNLVALPGQALNDIKEIYSHPVAIQQCSTFLENLRRKGVRVVESADTALSAKWVRDERLAGVAAIASREAALMYNLEIVAAEIESDKQNFTRFLYVSAHDHTHLPGCLTHPGADKAMLCFSLPHKVGSLSQVLSVLAYYQISLTKIQSLPVIGHPWEYLFHVDVQFADYRQYQRSLDAIRPLTDKLEILGEFCRGEMPSV